MIDVESLLQEISPDATCGEDLSYDGAMLELESAFAGKAEQQMGDSVSEGVEPNWEDVKDRSLELLSRSRDLRVIIQLSVAITKLDGIPGLQQGLSLLQQTIERNWEQVHPQLDPDDDNDPLERINILAGLNTPPGSIGDPIQFRQHIHHAPLSNSRGFGRVTYRNILDSRSGEATGDGGEDDDHKPMSSSEIEAAFMDTELDYLIECHEAAEGAKEAVVSLDSNLTDHVGSGASTSFDGILEDLRAIISELAQRLRDRGYGVESDEDEMEGGDAGGSGGGVLSGDVGSPRDAELALDKVVRYYELNEPSSPVPILVKVARSMISKSFLEISAVLPPDTVELIVSICGLSEDQD